MTPYRTVARRPLAPQVLAERVSGLTTTKTRRSLICSDTQKEKTVDRAICTPPTLERADPSNKRNELSNEQTSKRTERTLPAARRFDRARSDTFEHFERRSFTGFVHPEKETVASYGTDSRGDVCLSCVMH